MEKRPSKVAYISLIDFFPLLPRAAEMTQTAEFIFLKTYRAAVFRIGFTSMKHDFFLPLTFQRD